jgi:hypothetical protein
MDLWEKTFGNLDKDPASTDIKGKRQGGLLRNLYTRQQDRLNKIFDEDTRKKRKRALTRGR